MSRQVEVGQNFYLFHGDNGMSDFLLISAHGLASGSSFVVPVWTRLHFYAPRGRFLVMNISRFNLSALVEEEIDGGTECPNYLLAKYQGRHGGGETETYATLGALVDQTRNLIANGPPPPPVMPPYWGPNLRKKTMEEYKASYENLLPFDILTIRNRSIFAGGSLTGIPLSDALTAVERVHRYSYIFCSFCRGSISQGISDTLFDITGGRLGTALTHRVRTR